MIGVERNIGLLYGRSNYPNLKNDPLVLLGIMFGFLLGNDPGESVRDVGVFLRNLNIIILKWPATVTISNHFQTVAILN